MPWAMHYAGERLAELEHDAYEDVRGQIDNLVRHGMHGWIYIKTAHRTIDVLVTGGTPLYFSYHSDGAERPVGCRTEEI